MNISEENKQQIKSQRARELEELRRKGVAKERRNKLKDFASPLTTPEQAQQFLATMRNKSKKEEWEHRPPSNLSSDGVDAWYMMQRHREQEMRKRRQEAEQILRGYRAPYKDDASVDTFGGWSPKSKRNNHRASFGDVLSESLTDPSMPEVRRQSSMPRLQHNYHGHNNHFSSDAVSLGDASERTDRTERTARSSFPPERTQFLNNRRHYDGTNYEKHNDRTAFSNGRALFKEGDNLSVASEPRPPVSSFNQARYIDTSESQNRLREAGDRRSHGDPSDRRSYGDEGHRRSYDPRRYSVDCEVVEQRQSIDYRESIDQRQSFERRDPADHRDSAGYRESTGHHGSLEDSRHSKAQTPRFSMESDRETREAIQSAQTAAETPSACADSAQEIPETIWRDFISPEPGARFPPEAGRYHLYASYACPGSHRALIVRALKGLENVVSVTIVHPTWRHTNIHDPKDKHRGWVFGDPNGEPFQNTTGRGGPFPAAYPGNDPDPILNAYSVRDLYEYAQDTSGKYTIPLLWDKKLNTIVNNESSDISYMLNSCFNEFSENAELDLYTEDDEDGLDKLNEVSQWLYPMMIHGVYRCGFAKTQRAYDRAIEELTAAFDMADELLQQQRYLTGDILTDADIRLFVTLLRFDEVYAFYFRANTRLVMMTPALLNFCREIYQMPGVAETCQMDQIKAHFFGSHAEWNKYSVIPRGLGFMKLLDLPHDRDVFGEQR